MEGNIDALKQPLAEETHPWRWYHPEGAKTIIIGTFPPTRRNWSYNYFYPNKNNNFWKIMAELAGRKIENNVGEEAVSERIALLDQLKVGVSDMGYRIRRKSDSSLDQNLEIVEYMDIIRLLQENSSIRKIIFTSSSGKSSAMGWFTSYLKNLGIAFKMPKGERPLRTNVDIGGKRYEIVLLYSTSPRAGAGIPFARMVELFRNEIGFSSVSS